MSEELKSWTSDRSGNPIDIGGRVPIRSGTTLHGFDAPSAIVSDEVRINGEVFVRKSSSQARLSEAVKVLKPLVQYLEDDGPILASDIEVLSNAKAFLASIGEDNEA